MHVAYRTRESTYYMTDLDAFGCWWSANVVIKAFHSLQTIYRSCQLPVLTWCSIDCFEVCSSQAEISADIWFCCIICIILYYCRIWLIWTVCCCITHALNQICIYLSWRYPASCIMIMLHSYHALYSLDVPLLALMIVGVIGSFVVSLVVAILLVTLGTDWRICWHTFCIYLYSIAYCCNWKTPPRSLLIGNYYLKCTSAPSLCWSWHWYWHSCDLLALHLVALH